MNTTPPRQNAPPLPAIALIAMTVLGYEILLMRLFSIIQWHHFAYMVISLALLGYGVSGTFVTLQRDRLTSRFAPMFAANAAAFGVSALAAFLLAQRVPFNALEIFWDPRQPLRLLWFYLLLFVPFFFAGNCMCLAFACCGGSAHRIYSFDLIGAASGSLLTIAFMFALPPQRLLQMFAAMGVLAAAAAIIHFRLRPRMTLPALLAAAALLVALPSSFVRLQMSDYKSLSQQLRVSGARIVEQRSGPLGQLTVVESTRVPLRHAPGLSLNAVQEPPAQLGIYTDGEGPNALTHFDGDLAKLDYLDQMTSALPYHLLDRPHVLVLGAGAGAEVLQAVRHQASRIDAVELNPQLVDLVRHRYARFAGDLYARPEVRLHMTEARGFVAASSDRYDLIQVALLDAFGPSSAGLYGLSESFIYTVEALRSYLQHLRPSGMLAITRWVTLPPRDTLKLFATAIAALEREGVTDPGERLVLVRGWQTVTLLVKNGAFSTGDVGRIRAFSDSRSFDTDWFPGIRAGDSNRYNVLDTPWFYDGAVALLGPGREQFMERYKFNIRPATDDRPYFFNFFRWRTLREILALKQRGGLPLLELGYPVLVATLLQALLVSTLLIILPLVLRRAQRRSVPRARVFGYFSALGFGFMFIELAFIQKFTLLLAHPLYAVAVVLCAFLAFAGLGAHYSQRPACDERRLANPPTHRRNSLDVSSTSTGESASGGGKVWQPVLGIILLSGTYLLLLPALFRFAVTLSDPVKIVLSVSLIAPLAFCMGMPFLRGMATLASHSPAAVPWAYGINACASVTGATLANVLAIHLGFSWVVVLAMSLYGLAAVFFPHPPR